MRGARSGTALITGGNAGIGLATALAIATVGMDVVIVGRRARENRAAAARVQERGVRCLALECDVANGEAVERLFDRIEAECGPVSHAFNCAGLEQVQGPYDRATHEDYTRIFDTNVRGLWCCMRREVAGMRKRGGGAIVNAGSVSGSIAFAGIP